METINENEEAITPEPKGLLLPEEAQYYLQIIGKWGNFLAVVGYVGSVLIILTGLFFAAFPTLINKSQSTALPHFVGNALGGFYLVIGVFNYFASTYLYQFAEKIKKGIWYNDAVKITEAFSKLKSLFKLLGIATISIISIYFLTIIGFIIVAFITH